MHGCSLASRALLPWFTVLDHAKKVTRQMSCCMLQRTRALCMLQMSTLLGLRFNANLGWAAGWHGPVTVNSRSGNFTAGYHSIEVDYCNVAGTATLSLSWKGPNDTSYSVGIMLV